MLARGLVLLCILSCGFLDKDKATPADATIVVDGPVDAGIDAAPDECDGAELDELERVSDLAPGEHSEMDPVLARTTAGELWLAWVDYRAESVTGTLRVARAYDEDQTFAPSSELTGCEAVGRPSIAAVGELVVVAALCTDVGGRVCAYVWDPETKAWGGPTVVDDTDVGPQRSALVLAGGETAVHAAWVEDSALRISLTFNAKSWSTSEIVSDEKQVVVEGAVSGEDPLWLAYSFDQQVTVVNRAQGEAQWTIVHTTAGEQPKVAAHGDQAVVAYWLDGAAHLIWLPGAMEQKLGEALGSPELARGADGELHGLLMRKDKDALIWIYAQKTQLREATVPMTPVGLPTLVVGSGHAQFASAIETTGDIEIFREATRCSP